MPSLRSRWVFSDRHCRIVDQNADRKRHAAERHGVERVTQEVEDDNGRQIDSGIEIKTIRVDRRPRKSRIISR